MFHFFSCLSFFQCLLFCLVLLEILSIYLFLTLSCAPHTFTIVSLFFFSFLKWFLPVFVIFNNNNNNNDNSDGIALKKNTTNFYSIQFLFYFCIQCMLYDLLIEFRILLYFYELELLLSVLLLVLLFSHMKNIIKSRIYLISINVNK